MKLSIVAGARPNFMKIAPIVHAIERHPNTNKIQYTLVHTGQHYDQKMSQTFFDELNIPKPHVNLGCSGKTQAEQTGSIMKAYEKQLQENPADMVLVVGDVNSTMACAIVAKKMGCKLVHIEAGIRSYDLSMPEEINRMVTDSITDIFFTTSQTASGNLLGAGHGSDKIIFVGNVMIDTLLTNRPRFKPPRLWSDIKLKKGNYILVTLHRPSNVDDPDHFLALLSEIMANANGYPVVFPMHPRTRVTYEHLKYQNEKLIVVEPMGYLEFNYLVENAKAVITDSGGITEETTVLGVPCLTIRDNTERPETIEIGTNELIGTDPAAIKPALDKLFAGSWKRGGIPEFWDGKSASRIVEHLYKYAQ